ncbi:hypothetical protein HG530_004459 [Fusarium avenaceum]|nr:hypothetical protein HG530_004459 [Fusarium avenaceum]
MSDLVVETATLRIGEHDLDIRCLLLLLEILCHTRYRAACTSSSDKSSQLTIRLSPNLRTSRVVVRLPVSLRLELIRKESLAAILCLGSVLFRTASCKVNKVIRTGNRRRRDSFDGCAKMKKKIGLFESHVAGHADMSAGIGEEGIDSRSSSSTGSPQNRLVLRAPPGMFAAFARLFL